jgi:uncharacterized protein (DUF169 family)
MTQPLALDSAPHGEATGWRRGEEFIDALAYVDSLTPAERAAVDRLIAEEVRTVATSDLHAAEVTPRVHIERDPPRS